jgi:2-dehydropantoate 2-reductase
VRYLIIGAGAVGGTIGGRLYDSGHDVVLVARGAHRDALRDHGLRLELPERTLTLPIPVVDGPADLDPRPDDVLLLATKTQDTAAALQTWSGYADRPGAGGPAVVCAQNGVENERLALRRFRDVYPMCVWMPSSHLEPGVVQAPGAPLTGILHLGRYPSGTDDTARRISADLSQSGFDAPVVPDVMAWKYGKLLSNLANALEAVRGPVDDDRQRELFRRIKAEGAAALEAAGITPIAPAEQARVRGDRVELRSLNGRTRGGGSSWQSLMRGTGSIEADYLNGEIVLLGRRFGVPTPLNEAVQRTAGRFARERRRPGDLTAAELTALLDAGR